MARYRLTIDNLTSITSRYAGTGLSLPEMIERAIAEQADVSARSPSPGARSSNSHRTSTKKTTAASYTANTNADDLVAGLARKPSPFRTGVAANSQKISWESQHTNDVYESTLKQTGNEAVLRKYHEFKKTVRIAGTSAVLGIRPFQSQSNTWVYDLSDRFRVVFRKNKDGSITILKSVDHYHGQK
jgi:hypothetical protein